MDVRGVKILSLSLFLSACGGGGGSSDSPGVPVPNTLAISGTAYDSALYNATVTLRDKNGAVLTSARSDINGNFTFSINERSGIHRIETQGGSYIDEVSQNILDSDFPLEAHFNINGDTNNVAVTPLTTIVSGLAEYYVEQGSDLEEAVELANQAITSWIGFDVGSVIPLDVTVSEYESSDGFSHGLIAAGISGLVNNIMAAEGLLESQQGSVNFRPDIFINYAYSDIRFDGMLDGIDQNGQINMGSYSFSTQTYRQHLAGGIIRAVDKGAVSNASIADVLPFVGTVTGFTSEIFNDDTPATVTAVKPDIINLSISDGDVVFGVVDVSFLLVDFVGIESVTAKFDGVDISINNLVTPNFEINTANFPDGELELEITAVNHLGESTSKIIALDVSNNTIAFANVSLLPDQMVTEFQFIQLNASHPAGLSSVQFYIDAVPVQTNFVGDLFFCNIDTRNLAEGSHVFRVEATNNLSSTDSLTINFIVNNLGPVFNWNISNNIFIEGQTSIQVDFEETSPGSAELYLDGGLLFSQNQISDLNYLLDTTVLDEGAHTLYLNAVDELSNLSEGNRTVIVDNEPPEVWINYPNEGTVVTTQFPLLWGYRDENGMSSDPIEIYLDDRLYSTMSAGSSQRPINPASFPKGPHTLYVVVKDASGKVSTASLNVIFE